VVLVATCALAHSENGLPGGMDKADAADPNTANPLPPQGEMPEMSTPVSKADEDAAMAQIAEKQAIQADPTRADPDDMPAPSNKLAEAIIAPMRAKDARMDREVEKLVAAATRKQEAISQVVSDEMDAESAAQEAASLNEQISDVDAPDVKQPEVPAKEEPAKEEPAKEEPAKEEPVEEKVTVQTASSVMPQHELRQKQAERLAEMSMKLKKSKEAHAKKVKEDAVAVEKVKIDTAKASAVGDVLGKARQLLEDAQHHMQLIDDEIPEAAKNVATARKAAMEANTDLERELNKHHLSVDAIQLSKDEEQTSGHAEMLETIRKKRRAAASKLEDVQTERNTLDRIVSDAVRLMDQMVAEQASTKSSTLNSLRVDAAKAHVTDVKAQRAQMQEQLDQVQSEYQTAHDQLRDTELQSLLFDAKVAGKLTEGTIQQLNSKMELAAHADNVFAQAIQFAHKLNQEKVEARRQIEASAPVLKQTIQMLAKLKLQAAEPSA